MRRLAWLAIALASCVLAQDRSFVQIPDSQKLALVIGNSEYPKAPLKNPVNDASSMEAALKKIGFSVTTLRNADLATCVLRLTSSLPASVPDRLDSSTLPGMECK